MSGVILDKKGPVPIEEPARDKERRGMKTCLPQAGRWLSRLFFQIVDELLVGLTFKTQFTFSSANFDMNFWTSFPFIAN